MDGSLFRYDDSLTWFPEHGWGFYPVRTGIAPYDQSYFQRYQQMADTPMGKAITAFRVDLIRQHTEGGPLLDVGIGSGALVEAYRQSGGTAYGYDVNPYGVAWLEERGLYLDPELDGPIDSMSFFDVLEHIYNPPELLRNVRRFVFITMPIFRDADHVLASKHLRRDEHYWYFTANGLEKFMASHGFALRFRDGNQTERRLGREDVDTFVFERTHDEPSPGQHSHSV